MKRAGGVIILLLAFGGTADAAYLAQHALDSTSLAVYGVIFFVILFVLAALELFIFNRILRRAIQVIALFGVIAEIGFTLIQIYFINALCVYCLASAIIAFLILVFASIIEPVRRDMFDRRQYPQTPPPSQPLIQHLRMPPLA